MGMFVILRGMIGALRPDIGAVILIGQVGQPAQNFLHHAGVEGVGDVLAPAFIHDQPCLSQGGQVVRDGRFGRGEGIGDLAGGSVSLPQEVEDAPARFIA